MFTFLFMALIACLVFAAVGDPAITGSIRLNTKRYRKGDEVALAAVMTPEQHDDWQKRGLIEGNWNIGAPSSDRESTPSDGEPSTLESQLVEALRPYAGERGESEGALDVLNRIIDERNEATRKVTGQQTQFDQSYGDLQRQLDEETKSRQAAESAYRVANQDVEKLKAEAGAARTPADPFALVKSLGADVVENLVKAGFDSIEKIGAASDKELNAVKGIGPERIKELRALQVG